MVSDGDLREFWFSHFRKKKNSLAAVEMGGRENLKLETRTTTTEPIVIMEISDLSSLLLDGQTLVNIW